MQAKPHCRPVLGFPKAFMGIIETQLKHVGYELDMLVYTFDKLLLVEPLVTRSFQAGQVNALIEAFCIHARNLDEFFQCSGQGNTLKAATFADSRYKPRPNDKERKNSLAKSAGRFRASPSSGPPWQMRRSVQPTERCSIQS
jgi:hypothetical protein